MGRPRYRSLDAPLNARAWKTETVYAITDLDRAAITPEQIAGIAHGHWHVENRLH